MTTSAIKFSNNNFNEPPTKKRKTEEQRVFAASQHALNHGPNLSTSSSLMSRVSLLTDEQFNSVLNEIDSSIQSKEYKEALDKCLFASDVHPERQALLQLRRAYCYNALGQWNDAKFACGLGLRQAENRETIAYLNMRMAFAHYASDDLDSSLRNYDQAIEIFQQDSKNHAPVLYPLYLERSRLWWQLGQRGLAEENYQSACQIENLVPTAFKIPAQSILADPSLSRLPESNPFVEVSLKKRLYLFELTQPQTPDLSRYPLLKVLSIHSSDPRFLPKTDRNYGLTELELSENGLKIPPDLSGNPHLTKIDLHNNELTKPPLLIGTPALHTFWISKNKLIQTPDLTRCPLLNSVDFSENDLTVPPDVTYCPRLTRLNLTKNELKQSPNLSYCGDLKEFSIAENLLVDPPVFEDNPKLQSINISHNPLGNPPNISENKNLIYLKLAHTKLKIAPILDKNLELKTLDLSHNDLEKMPDLSQNGALETLEVSWNALEEISDLTPNSELRILNISHNHLTELPDSLLLLSNNCQVQASGNRFTHEYIENFQIRLEEYRRQNPSQGPTVIFYRPGEHISVKEELNFWSEQFETNFPDSQNEGYKKPDLVRLSLDHESQQVLGRFLSDLRKMPDYLNPDMGEEVILQIEKVLQLACDHPEFRSGLIALMEESLNGCGDRTQTFYNKIQILYQFHSKELTDTQFKRLAIGAERHYLLEQYVIEEYKNRGGEEKEEELEAFLDYQIALQKPLDLPILSKKMENEGVSAVTEEMIDAMEAKIKAIPDKELLAHSGHWLDRIQKGFPEKCAAIGDHFVDLVEQAREYFECDLEDRAAFLIDKKELAECLAEVKEPHYNAVAKFLALKKEEKIAKLKE